MDTITPDTAALTAESQSLLVPKDFKVTTTEQYVQVASKLTGIKAMLKKIGEVFDPHIKRAFDSHRSLVAEKRTHEAPLLAAEQTLKGALLAHQREQERIRREAEAKAREAADKARAKLEAQAAKLAEKGKAEQAEEKRQQAAVIPTPVIETQTPKVAGIATKETWAFEVTDKSIVPDEYKDVNTSRVGAVVRAMKSATNIPGIKAYPVSGISARSS